MTPKAKINSSSMFLVSGGARGITAQCVINLAQSFPCKWILLGRSDIAEDEPTWARDCFDESELKKRTMESFLAKGEQPTPLAVQKVFKKISSRREILKNLSTLKEAGSEAVYLNVDVTDAIALSEKLAPVVERIGPITGIIHGAGNLADKLIEKKTEQDFETVYNPKVKGLENLLHCVRGNQLDYLVLFSSVVGFYGNAGQADYAVANEILNKSAHLVKQHHPNCHVVAINWGPWDSGMVTPELKKAYALRQIEILPVEGATQMLVNELKAVERQTPQVIIGKPLPAPVVDLGSELHTHRIHRRLTLEANPFLEDHQIGGYPVLPSTCALSWIFASCQQLYPGYTISSCTDFKILKGIAFDGSLESEYTLELQEIAKNKDDNSIEFDAKIWSKNKDGKTRYHFSARPKFLAQLPEPPIYESLDLTEDRKISGSKKTFYQDDGICLFHGPTFQGIEQVLNITPEKITARYWVKTIEERQQGQFPIHAYNPYITDSEMHAAWIWLQHFYHSGGLPANMGKFKLFMPVPFNKTFYVSTEIKSKTNAALVSNMIVHDADGKIYSRMDGATATIFPLPLKFRTK